MSDGSLWIFGYGSLVWRPAISHRRRVPARISGFVRRFWQGSTDHRGVPSRPGRVVTLLPASHASIREEEDGTGAAVEPLCFGTAYEVAEQDRDAVLAALDHRERAGYERLELELCLLGDAAAGESRARGDDGDGTASGGPPLERVPGLVYVAGPENPAYLGPAPVDAIARQIAAAEGPSGANPEYVFELAHGLRAMEAVDPHVFAVEAALRTLVGGLRGDGLDDLPRTGSAGRRR